MLGVEVPDKVCAAACGPDFRRFALLYGEFRDSLWCTAVNADCNGVVTVDNFLDFEFAVVVSKVIKELLDTTFVTCADAECVGDVETDDGLFRWLPQPDFEGIRHRP